MMPHLKGRRILPVFFGTLLVLPALVETAQAVVDPASISDEAPKIRVLLKQDVPSLEITGWDVEALSSESALRRLRRVGRQSWKWKCRPGRVELSGATGGSSVQVFRGPVELRSPAGTLFWGSTMVREALVVHPSKNGCAVVNRLDIEKYLDGVVNGEFSSKWSPEAVSAQVVAARSYAFYQIRDARRRRAIFDVESNIRDQVYLGTKGEEARASLLVARTRGLVLVAGPAGAASPIKAFYHSTCGGHTDSPEEVWGKPQEGVRGGVDCVHCGTSPRFTWQLKLTPAQLDQALQSYGKGGVIGLEVLSRFASGRVKKLKIAFASVGGRISTQIIPGSQFRSLVGSEQLRSTAFTISRGDGDSWLFDGRGYGHGVGMCQWGAKEMGAAGFEAREILSRYYPSARIVHAWR
jgi:stage II sporulation protein D